MLRSKDLFGRLAEGHAARITVVTPNRRLSQALQAEFDVFQLDKNLVSWEAPDILPFGAFVERLWEDALYSDTGQMSGGSLPLLLTPAQEQAIWEEILASAELLSVAQAARQCREAWRLLHGWRIPPGHGGDSRPQPVRPTRHPTNSCARDVDDEPGESTPGHVLKLDIWMRRIAVDIA